MAALDNTSGTQVTLDPASIALLVQSLAATYQSLSTTMAKAFFDEYVARAQDLANVAIQEQTALNKNNQANNIQNQIQALQDNNATITATSKIPVTTSSDATQVQIARNNAQIAVLQQRLQTLSST